MKSCYTGYHSTDKKNELSIIKSGFDTTSSFRLNINQEDAYYPNDLGIGTYFFVEDNFSDAYKNSVKFFKKFRNKSEDISTLKCEIEVDENKLIDMNDEKNIKAFNDFFEKANKLIEKYYKSTANNNMKKRAVIDGIILEFFIQRNNLYPDGIIMKTHTYFNDLDVRYRSSVPNGTEIAIRNKKCIISITKCV